MEDELALRTRMTVAGLWLSALLLGSVGVWVAATWDRPHRGGLLAMAGAAAVATVVIALLPRERIVAGRHREVFFLGWSLSLIVFIDRRRPRRRGAQPDRADAVPHTRLRGALLSAVGGVGGGRGLAARRARAQPRDSPSRRHRPIPSTSSA